MAIPTREERLAHAKNHCVLWNAGDKDAWINSWRTICKGELYMHDPVGTELKSGFKTCQSDTYDTFQPLIDMEMLTVKVNGNEMAWVIGSYSKNDRSNEPFYSIETFRWEEDGTLHINTFYDMPESVGVDDDPYEHTLGGRT